MTTSLLLDTNIISELRKGEKKANNNVWRYLGDPETRTDSPCYLSVITLGELRRGVEMIRHRNDHSQAAVLDAWVTEVESDYSDHIIDIDKDVAKVWGLLTAKNPQNPLDKLIAATAIVYDMPVVTRNVKHFDSAVTVVDLFEETTPG